MFFFFAIIYIVKEIYMKFEEKLHNFARLVAEVGINIDKGQKLVISTGVKYLPFARMVQQLAYENGAKKVILNIDDPEATKIGLMNMSDETLSETEDWLVQKYSTLVDENAAFFSIKDTGMKVFKDVPPEKISLATNSRMKAFSKYRDRLSKSLNSWNLVVLPSEEWAHTIFPEMDESEALDRLWDEFFAILRADRDDPVTAWQEHVSSLARQKGFLNEKRFRRLHFKSETADLHVELVKKHNWQGGAKQNEKGRSFVANMPTEEVHTMPLKTGVNGWVKSTKPLNYLGKLIEDFEFEFKDGEIVSYRAGTGEDTLKSIIETDEGSRYLGEVAIVPVDSPISMSGLVFYNTLFDENSSCHLAIGNAYPTSMIGGREMTDEELLSEGANKSLVHVDFMIGSDDLCITAYDENENTQIIFENGKWTI